MQIFNVHLLVWLKKSKKNKQGKSPLYIRITISGQRMDFSSGIRISENQWDNKNKTIILVESEKTALVCALHLPEYIWLAYGGINGLTMNKLDVLIGHKVILVPDISQNAVSIMNNKLPNLIDLGIDAKIWDMTDGKTDEQLKNEGLYNCDLEDVFRVFAKNE